MKNLYLYFSGTGNTKYVVQKIIDKYEDGDDYLLQSIEYKNINYDELIIKADTIIIAYPIYDSMLPFIVSEFLEEHLQSFRNKKVIALCTQLLFSGDGGGLPYYILKKVKVNLLHSIHINMPSNLVDVRIFPNKPLSETEKKYDKAHIKIEKVVHKIKSGQSVKDGRRWYSRALGFFIQRAYGKAFLKKLRKSVKINHELCINCDKCVEICPMDNLFDENNTISQNGKCTLCYRCVNECPAKAISIFTKKPPKVQYTRHDYN